MRILHLSDTHGSLPRLNNRADCILHTGDYFPNSHHIMQGNRVREAEFQMRWLEDHVSELKGQINGHPFLFVLGNHDFVNPQLMAQFLNSEGIQAIDLTNQVVSFRDVNFYGFPYIPYIHGRWNYERQIPEMQQEIRRMVDVLNNTKVDVLACHSPIYGCLDYTIEYENIGNRPMADALDYKIKKEMLPTHYFCGHNHQPAVAMRNGILISNMATSQCVIKI